MFAYGTNPQAVDKAVKTMSAALVDAESRFESEYHEVDDAILLAAGNNSGKPVFLIDTQDNPGAGGNADTIGLLEGLLRHDVPDSALGVLFDPEVAVQSHAVGVGREIDVLIGAKSGFPGEQPLNHRFRVEQLGDGKFVALGKYFGGARMDLGPMVRLRSGNVQVVVASRKEQAADRAMFQHVGLDPSRKRLLGLKSSVHFRADLEPLASRILIVLASGPNVADPNRLPYRNLRPGVRKSAVTPHA